MPNRLFRARDGVQWIVSVHGFVGEGAATFGEELPDYDRARVVFASVSGGDRRSIWVALPHDLEGADQEQLEAMLDLAEPNRLRPEKD